MVIGILIRQLFYLKSNFTFMAHKHQEPTAQKQDEGAKHAQKNQKPADEKNEGKEILPSNIMHGQNKKGNEYSNESAKKQSESSKGKGSRKENQDVDQDVEASESYQDKKSGKAATMPDHSSSHRSGKR
jgi:hypothetical protein